MRMLTAVVLMQSINTWNETLFEIRSCQIRSGEMFARCIKHRLWIAFAASSGLLQVPQRKTTLESCHWQAVVKSFFQGDSSRHIHCAGAWGTQKSKRLKDTQRIEVMIHACILSLLDYIPSIAHPYPRHPASKHYLSFALTSSSYWFLLLTHSHITNVVSACRRKLSIYIVHLEDAQVPKNCEQLATCVLFKSSFTILLGKSCNTKRRGTLLKP